MGAQRRSRTARPSRVPLALQERDPWILESIAKMRFLSTAQLAALHFGGSQAATIKRMAKLHAAGLVRAWVPDANLAGPNVYSLDRKGAKMLATEGSATKITVPQGLDGSLAHALLINDVRIALALAVPEAGGKLEWWRSDRELAGSLRERLVPDALFLIRWPDRVQELALEVEHRTRAPQRFLDKILRYQALAGQGLYGLSDLTTLVVATEESWLVRYRLALQRVSVTFPVFFTLVDNVKSVPMGKVWIGVQDEVRHSLRTLPYRTEGRVRVSPRGATTVPSEAGGLTTI